MGDTRVGFEAVPSQEVSVVAKQTEGGLSTYTTKSGGTVLLVEAGYHDEDEMFRHANQELTFQTWAIRLVGWLFLFISFRGIMRPSSVCAGPCVGSLLEVGITYLPLGLATGTTTIVIAIVWIVYRPLFYAVLFLIIGLGSWLTAKHVRSNIQITKCKDDIPEAQVIERQEGRALPDSKFMDEPDQRTN